MRCVAMTIWRTVQRQALGVNAAIGDIIGVSEKMERLARQTAEQEIVFFDLR